VGLGDIPNPSDPFPGPHSSAGALTSDGLTVFGSSDSGAFRWTQATGMVLLQPSNFFPSGASGDGSVLVGNQSSQAVRWTMAAGIMGLGFLPGATDSSAIAVSQDGTTVVGTSNLNAFRWTSATGMIGLGLLNGLPVSQARGVSANGGVIVGYGTTTTNNVAFIWDPVNGLRTVQQVLTSDGIDLTGWTLTEADGISADGRTIVGQGTDPAGFSVGWIAVIPEPGTGLLVMAGVLGLAIKQRKSA